MTNIVHSNTDQLFEQISHLITEARSYVAKTVNTAMVVTYYEIGRHIVKMSSRDRVVPNMASRYYKNSHLV